MKLAEITTCTCGLTPSGRLELEVKPGDTKQGSETDPAAIERISTAFAQGNGQGLLHLGAVELGGTLAPSLAFWREFAHEFVSSACAVQVPTDPARIIVPSCEASTLARYITAVPPMRGAELVDANLLEELWGQLGAALCERAREYDTGVRGLLEQGHSSWHVAGRVCLHLAENKRDPERPFAFIATYARGVPGRESLQYVPLSRALQEYAGARNKQKLLALLTPLQRAAAESELLHELIDAGSIYHPLAWTAAQAYAFLSSVSCFERAGLVVRVPDWWKARSSKRPTVSVTVGDGAPSTLGLDALLDFNIELTLGGERLKAKEIESLLQASAGLVLIKGNWVEVDPDKLGEMLSQWREVQDRAAEGGLGFAEALRLLAGADLGGASEAILETAPEWSQVIAGKWLHKKLEGLRSGKILAAIERNAGLQGELRPYQRRGVQWLFTLHTLGLGGLLADDMGLGKTIQVLALLMMLHKDKRSTGVDLLVVPASLIDNWALELERFAPKLRVLIAHPSKIPTRQLKALPASKTEAHDVVITTYGTVMRTPWMVQRDWRCAVLDEAQAIKNPSAKQTRAIKSLQARSRLALTGTPVENRLGDLWSIFDFINPGLLGTPKAFGNFCKSMSERAEGRYTPLRQLISPYILRRLKTDRSIISDLPDKTEVTAHCLLSKTQAALYKQAVEELRRALDDSDGIQRRGIVLAYLMRFKQICNHPSQWLGDGGFEAQDSGKFKRLEALSESISARQEKLLVFTQFRTMAAPLERHLQHCFGRGGLVLHGGTPVKKRQGLVQSFQEDGGPPFMVLSLKAGGTGLNLTAANHVIHFDRWWNPAVERQATDRAYRIGQQRNVLVHKFVCKGTVEERIDELITNKQQLSDELLSGNAEAKLTELSNAELLAMVNLDLQSAVSS